MCPSCDGAPRPGWRGRAHLPRADRFNQLVAADLFYIQAMEETRPVLNLIDYGSNVQVCTL
eukprot:4763946-Pyramimonas_sp.AAC.1